MKKLISALLTGAMIFTAGCVNESDEQMRISVLSAGKADAIIIETEKGNVLIDTGLEENKDELLDALAERGIDSLYALIITHFDKDHVGGADWVVSELDVEHVYTSYQTKQSDDITSFEEALAKAGLNAMVITDTQTFSLGSVSFEVSGTDTEFDKNESNNSSLITKVTLGEYSYLFMGDAQNERIMEYLEENDASAYFLKVPYHGHYQKRLDELLEEVSPAISVITNSSEEPDEAELTKTVSLLNEYGSEVYMTSYGTVENLCTPQGCTVSQ